MDASTFNLVTGFFLGLLPGILWAAIDCRRRTKEVEAMTADYEAMRQHYLEWGLKNNERSRLNEH